jgi:hypothetical protein
MTDDNQIIAPVNDVNELALALERGELGIGCDPVPELQPPWGLFFIAPDGTLSFHPLASAYRAARKAEADRGTPAISAHPHKQRREATERYEGLKARLAYKSALRREGEFAGGVRRLIDLDVLADLALRDLRTIEAKIFCTNRTKRVAKRRERARPEYVTIGGEVYPVSK